MRRRSQLGIVGRLALVLICTGLVGPTYAFGQAADNEPRTAAAQVSHVSKVLLVPTRGGGVQKLLVDIGDWAFRKGDTDFAMPSSIGAIMTVGNGRVSVLIAGVATTYSTGDYWTVPAGTHMTISIKAPAQGAIVRAIIAIPTT
jgi:hypothetical protein